MQRQQLNIRLKKIVIERMKLIASQERRTIQDLCDEIFELGLIEYMKGDRYVKE